MTWLFVFLLILWGFASGIGEGITMYFAAPRFHPWFGFYHSYRLCEIGLLFAAGAAASVARPGYMLAAGALILSWELKEIGYAKARLGQAAAHENILGIYSIDGVGTVLALHLARLLIGIAFISLAGLQEA